MDLTLNETQRETRAAAHDYARTLIDGVGAREHAHAVDPAVIVGLGERGLLGVNLPTQLGGRGAGVVAYALAVQEIAAVDPAVSVTMAVTNMVGEVITRFGSDAQRAAYVPMLTAGRCLGGAFALSEPGAGSDAASLRTRAERDGDHWILNGEKLWITTGDEAGVVVIWARTGGEGHRGISCFLAPGDTPGLVAGKPEEKMGLRASHTVPVSLSDVRLPGDAMLSHEGEGFKIAMVALDGGRIGIGSQSVGMARAVLAESRELLLQLDGPAAADIAAAHVADMATELEAAAMLVLRAAWLKEQARPFSREAAMAKVFASESANRMARRSLQILGQTRRMGDTPAVQRLTRLVRDARVAQIYEGTSEIQRLVIAREALRAS